MCWWLCQFWLIDNRFIDNRLILFIILITGINYRWWLMGIFFLTITIHSIILTRINNNLQSRIALLIVAITTINNLVGGLEHFLIFPSKESSSQLTFIFFRGVAQPPTSNDRADYINNIPSSKLTQTLKITHF